MNPTQLVAAPAAPTVSSRQRKAADRLGATRLLLGFGLWLGFADMSHAITILTQPQSQFVMVGSNVTFSASATTSTGYSYSKETGTGRRTNVYYTGQVSGLLTNKYDFFGVGDRITIYYDTLKIYDATHADDGKFTVSYGPGSNRFVTVIMNEAGGGSSWEYTMSMLMPVYYQWHQGAGAISGATNPNYTITSAQTNHAGDYTLVANDVYFNYVGSQTAVLTVVGVLAYGDSQFIASTNYSFASSVSVQLQTGYPSGNIYYTLDGSTPTASSTHYTAPFTLTTNALLRAVGVNSGGTQSAEGWPIAFTKDYPIINVQATDSYAAEAKTNAGVFTVTREGFTNKAVTVQLNFTGTATPGVDYVTLPTNITFAVGVVKSNLTVTPLVNAGTEPAETVVLNLKTNAAYGLGLYTNAVVTITGDGGHPRDAYPKAERYVRGSGTNLEAYSMVIPLDGLHGTRQSELGDFGYATVYHYNATNSGNQAYATNRIAYNTPIASFGSAWGTPLYLGQSYSLGIYAGLLTADPIKIYAYRLSDGGLEGVVTLTLPYLSNTNDWSLFATNGFSRTTNGYGLTTVMRAAPDLTWGTSLGPGWLLTHTATDEATNYTYAIDAAGIYGTQYLTITAAGTNTFGHFYELNFEPRPAWHSVFIDQPHFQSEPLPPDLWNKTAAELLDYSAAVTNTVSLSPSACTNLDLSPELRRHPLLDQFVADLNRDPLALANYVQNEIELTDPLAYRDDGQVQTESVNQGGVNRGALGVYQEGQGSPIEQCALLVYLLRQAGYPATYVFPPEGGLKLLDTRLSALLRMRINGGQDDHGRLYTTNQLITVNYPWVATYISNQWVHVFPWIKDTAVEEGLNLWDYLPTPYKETQLWVKDYVYGKTNLTAFATSTDDTPGTIFPRWLDNELQQNAPGISVSDLGMSYHNRRHLYARWSDFPRPTWVTNNSTAVESLASTGITNVSPALTNIFDTVSVELYSVANPQKSIGTSELRMADLHNRKFFLSHTNLANGLIQATLTLAPFRPDATGSGTFSASDLTLTNQQVLTLSLNYTDDQLRLRVRHRRQRAFAWTTALDPDRAFLDLVAVREVLAESSLRKGDVAALCLHAGRVTPAMLRVHAQELWNMEQQLSTNAAAAGSIPVDVYQGSLVYLLGMNYYQRVANSEAEFRRLFKVQHLSRYAMGLAKISPRRHGDGSLYNGAVDPIWPNVDMFFREVVTAGNGTTRLDSGWGYFAAIRNFFNLAIANESAQEHATLNVFYGQSNAVSTVKLLQLAQSKVATGGSNVVELHYHNYAAEGNKVYYGKALKDHDPGLWTQVVNLLVAAGGYGVAWLPPGPLTNASGSFAGMGALVLGGNANAALIGNNQYGAYASPLPVQTVASATLSAWLTRLLPNGDYSQSFYAPTPVLWQSAPEAAAAFNWISDYALLNSGALLADPYQQLQASINSRLLFNTDGSYASSYAPVTDLGAPFNPDFREGNGLWNTIADPVNTLTGEFYVDDVDLSLPGPMPLQVRRNYGSHNLAAAQLGYGWKLNYLPYLTVAPSNDVIYAAEPSGSVLAFGLLSSNLWAPTAALNPTLNNNTANGIGSVANHFNARLAKATVGATNYYYLTNGDGSLRVFQEMSFPLLNSPDWDRLRPYLTTWYDNRSNFYRFEYGTNATAADYGQVRRIVSSSGNILRFLYDVSARVVEAYSLDGRRVQYDYDTHGDLVTVTRPDRSELGYEYQLAAWTTNSITNSYSTHLLTKELKPDGRVLQNEYDEQRRVTNQWATVGPDLRLVRNATFRYTNNFALTNISGTVSGTTTVLDYTNNPTTYFYTNGLIRRIRDPFNAELVQDWYEAGETNAPAYPRSLKTVTDQRSLLTSYFYDERGNVTNTTVQGDLLGDGNTGTTAISTALYNANNLPTQTVDAKGTTNLFFYTNAWLLARLENWPANATAAQAITNLYTYASATNATDGTVAYGLRVREVRAAGSPDAATNEWTYSSRGFPTAQVRYPGTGDPAVTVTNLYNYRGELTVQTDAAGRSTVLGYDPLGRPQSREVFESGSGSGTGVPPVSWDFSYYNENGELTWTDGPRYHPEDYIWRDYDGAGRPTEEIRWRSQAKTDGTGVEAPSPGGESQGEGGLYATTFQEYDAFNNLTKVTDPRGNYSRKQYDALGRLLREEFYDRSNVMLATNGFRYNAAGDVTNAFNPLGGLTEKQYTSAGKPKFQRNADGSTNAWRYYADGRSYREIQGNGAYWQTTYDDANRKTTRVFYSAAGSPLATNVAELDRRGNLVKRTDAGGNVFTNWFDGLDRLKKSAGPAIVTVTGGGPGPGGELVTNVLQQSVTTLYDAAGVALTNINALGEKTITVSDALGRPTRTEIRAANGTLVRETSSAYAPDHHSVTVTNGSGSAALVATTFTDNSGQPLLAINYPSATAREFTLREYDLAGNLVYEERDSSTNGVVTSWSGAAYQYDGLNRVAAKADRDAALTTYGYDAMGNLTNRAMPGGLQWSATYSSAGQKLTERNIGAGGSGTRSNSYAYFAAGSPFAGLLQLRTEPRGYTTSYGYDDWLRPTNIARSTADPYTVLTTVRSYDARGLLTNLTELDAGALTGSNPRVIARTYDAYGQMMSEVTSLNGATLTTAGQAYDAAGRRTALTLNSQLSSINYAYGWRADGSLGSVSTPVGGGSYSYNAAGVLTNRSVGSRTTTTTSLDGIGRPLSITTKVNLSTKLTETLAYTGDGLLSAHTLAREDFTNSRNYSYADLTRRLAEERLNLDATKRWTNTFAYDGGQLYGPGALTRVAATPSSPTWSGGTDAYARVNNGTNATIRRPAYGRVNGIASITALLDGVPQPVSSYATNDTVWINRWRTPLELSPGAHELVVTAKHPSGQFTTNATSWFTN